MGHTADAEWSSVPATPEELAQFKPKLEETVAIWACPRCNAEFRKSIVTDRPVYGFDIETVDSGEKDDGYLDFVCECGTKHKGGGENTNCGFAARLPVKRS
jgi:hypothetical protein